jgi:hypothetical protein
MSMNSTIRLSVLCLIVAFCSGCSDGCSNKSAMSPSGTGTSGFQFQASPISIDAIRYIMPLGYISPVTLNGFAQLPSKSIYFYFANPDAGESPVALRTPVFAPAAGTVGFVSMGGPGGPNYSPDISVSVNVTPLLQYTMSNVIPDGSVVPGASVSAGQRLGTTGSDAAVGLALVDYAVVGINTFPAGNEPPLRFFQEPIRSQLYGKVQRLGSELDGKFDYNVAGRLSGTWYLPGYPIPTEYYLCFAYDTYDPSQPRLSLGFPIVTNGGVFAVGSGDPDPMAVSVGSGLVRYTLTRSRTGLPMNGGPGGTLLVQMLTDTTIRVQWFPDGTSASSFNPGSVWTRPVCPDPSC